MKKNNYNYFEEFKNNAECSLQCSEKVYEVITKYSQTDLKKILEETHEIEHKADNGKHKMINYLLKDFLPPIEREDIINLSQKIDDVTDLIEEIIINIDMFNISAMRKETVKFVELLANCCKKEYELLDKFKAYKKFDKAQELIIEINRLEEKGDSLYIETIRNLYRDGTNTIDIIKWTTIYNCFEDCFDTCESVANDIESIIMKNL